MDWGQPYSCESWATTFGQSFPILDDNSGSSIYGLFGVGYVPHNVVIGGDGLVIFSESGFNQGTMIAMIEEGLANLILDVDEDGVLDSDDNCVDISNPTQDDIDSDGDGDACDPCDNLHVFTHANIDGTIDVEGNPIIDIFDVMALVEILLENDQESCGSEIADMNSDGNQNVVDIITLVQILLNGETDNSNNAGSGIFKVENSIESTEIMIFSDEELSGIQFEVVNSEISDSDLNSLVLPVGWALDYRIKNQSTFVIIYDLSGQNSVNRFGMQFGSLAKNSFRNIVVSSKNANEISIELNEEDIDKVESVLIPEKIGISSLYPNPFNPTLNISFSIKEKGEVFIAIYNAVGQKVRVLSSENYFAAGSHSLNWDASGQPSGLYFIKVETDNFSEIKKAILVK